MPIQFSQYAYLNMDSESKTNAKLAKMKGNRKF